MYDYFCVYCHTIYIIHIILQLALYKWSFAVHNCLHHHVAAEMVPHVWCMWCCSCRDGAARLAGACGAAAAGTYRVVRYGNCMLCELITNPAQLEFTSRAVPWSHSLVHTLLITPYTYRNTVWTLIFTVLNFHSFCGSTAIRKSLVPQKLRSIRYTDYTQAVMR